MTPLLPHRGRGTAKRWRGLAAAQTLRRSSPDDRHHLRPRHPARPRRHRRGPAVRPGHRSGPDRPRRRRPRTPPRLAPHPARRLGRADRPGAGALDARPRQLHRRGLRRAAPARRPGGGRGLRAGPCPIWVCARPSPASSPAAPSRTAAWTWPRPRRSPIWSTPRPTAQRRQALGQLGGALSERYAGFRATLLSRPWPCSRPRSISPTRRCPTPGGLRTGPAP